MIFFYPQLVSQLVKQRGRLNLASVGSTQRHNATPFLFGYFGDYM